jgi:transcriptional regulator GlxA family with amidase domain
MNTLFPSRSPQEIAKSRRIGVLVWPGCDVVDVCGPIDAFFYAKYWLPRFGRIEPGYLCDIIAATPRPIRTTCGIERIAIHSYSDLEDGLDTLVVAGGAEAEQASRDLSLVEGQRKHSFRRYQLLRATTTQRNRELNPDIARQSEKQEGVIP